MERINFQAVEKNGKKISTQKLKNSNGKKFYCLEMFPYPRENSYGPRQKLYDWRCDSSI